VHVGHGAKVGMSFLLPCAFFDPAQKKQKIKENQIVPHIFPGLPAAKAVA